jgi:hypothetical protein
MGIPNGLQGVAVSRLSWLEVAMLSDRPANSLLRLSSILCNLSTCRNAYADEA